MQDLYISSAASKKIISLLPLPIDVCRCPIHLELQQADPPTAKMKVFIVCALVVAVTANYAFAAELPKTDELTKTDEAKTASEQVNTDVAGEEKKEGVEERGYLGHHVRPAYGGGYGQAGGFNNFGAQGQASGFNQGANKFAQGQQFSNAGGFKNTQGFREQQGFSHTSNNQHGSGFNTNAGGFNKQQNAFGQAGGSYGHGVGHGVGHGIGYGRR